jgi:biotin synthase
MNESTQALALFAGANSIFYGDELLTTDNPASEKDQELLRKLGIKTN